MAKRIYDDADVETMYREMLDECFPMVKIGNLEYYPSKVLECVDPIAYRCGFTDYLDAEGYVECDGGYIHETDANDEWDEDENED